MSAFNAIYRSVDGTFGLIDPGQVMQKKLTRTRIFGACLRLSGPGRVGYKTGMALNILGPVTACYVTTSLLKMIDCRGDSDLRAVVLEAA